MPKLNIKQLPEVWKGRDYNKGGRFGKKILILGESTHKGDDPDNQFDYSLINIYMAKDHIEKAKNPKNGHSDRFRTKLMRVFLKANGEKQDHIEEFWYSVTFFNYIIPPLSKSRKQPNKEQWENHQPLDYRLNELKPDLLVVLGYRMWNWLLKHPPDGIKITKAPTLLGASIQPLYLHLNNGFKVLAYALRHPSSAFSYRKQVPLLSEIIKRA